MTYYYWGPSAQQQMGQQYGQQPYYPYTQTQTTPTTTSSGTPGFSMFPSGAPATGPAAVREESYIENILRLNRGKPGTFYFTVPAATSVEGRGNTKVVRGVVEEAGRDHAVIRELSTDHHFLFPMIYFDFAEFDEHLNYLNSVPIPGSR